MKRALLISLIFGFVLTAAGRQSGQIPLTPPHIKNQDRDTTLTEHFSIYYVCDSIDINVRYLDNERQIEHILNYLENSPRIDSITIHAWASPEGGYNHNRWLSTERAKTAKRFLLAHTPDSTKLNSDKIKINPLAENWPGLTDLVTERYHRHDREKVLKILHDTSIGDETRKWRLQQLDNGYTWSYLIRRLMPELRAATWICVWAQVPLVIPMVKAPAADTLSAPYSHLTRPEPETPKRQKTILGLKTNLLYDAVTALNFAVEVPINRNFSFLYEHHCPWWLSKNNRYCLQFLAFGGEARWWFAPRTSPATADRKQRDALMGHFVGLNAWGGKSDIQINRSFGCYQFEFFSAGLTYGYAMPIGKYLNMEFSISAGYARIPYRHYIPTDDWQILIRDKNKAGTLHYFGPTKAEISLVIPIRATFKQGKRGNR